MPNDIVARLRNLTGLTENLCHEAADEIERLQVTMDVLLVDRRAALSENHDLWREIERLRAALLEIVEECRNNPIVIDRMIDRIEETARAALEGEKKNDAAT